MVTVQLTCNLHQGTLDIDGSRPIVSSEFQIQDTLRHMGAVQSLQITLTILKSLQIT